MLKRVGWTYVYVLHSESQDDLSAMESFKKAAARSNICVSETASFPADATESDVGHAMVNLVLTTGLQSSPNVVVIFSSPLQASWIVDQAIRQPSIIGRIQWVLGQHALSDSASLDALTIFATRSVVGVVADELVRAPTSNFDDFFKATAPGNVNPSQNPWFNNFWQDAYQCNLAGSTKYSVPCGPVHEEMHRIRFKLNPYTNLVEKTISNFNVGLNNAQQAMCGSGSTGICDALRNMRASELLNYIQDAGYKANGDPATVKFAIQNYKSTTGKITVSVLSIYIICDMIKRNESDVSDVVFEILAKTVFKSLCVILFLALSNNSATRYLNGFILSEIRDIGIIKSICTMFLAT